MIGANTCDQRSGLSKTLFLGLCLVASFCLYNFAPSSMTEMMRRSAALFLLGGLLWTFEVLPLHAVSLTLVLLHIVFLSKEGAGLGASAISYQEFLRPFASPVIMLFFGGFVLSRAMTKHGVAQYLAARILAPFARSSFLFLTVLTGITVFLSMWMSNTAAAAMLLAILLPAIRQNRPEPFHKALILAVAFGTSLGGIATPIGTPPNAMAMAALRESGHVMTFADWMAAGLPVTLLLSALMIASLYVFFPPQSSFTLDLSAGKTLPLSPQGWITASAAAAAIGLWLTQPFHGLDESLPALGAAAFLTCTGLLDRDDLNSLEWDVLILMWGGLVLSQGMMLSGLAAWLGGLSWESLDPAGRTAAVAALGIFLSLFMSNTASAGLMIPLAIAAGGPGREISSAFLAATATSLAVALPISTPPNAMAFACGGLRSSDMMKPGLVLTLGGFAILLLAEHFLIGL